MTGRVGALGQGTAVSLVPAHPPQPLCWPPHQAPLPPSPFSPCPHTHVAVPCSLPPATNLQGAQSWSHTEPPTPVAPRPHCHSPRMRSTTIGAMRQEQLGDSETAAEEGSGRRAAFGFQGRRCAMMMTPPHFCICYPQGVVSFRFCHRLPYMELELPSLLGTILTGDSSRNHWGHSDTHTDLCHMLRTHTCALFCTCICAHTLCHRNTEAEH